MYSEGHQTAGHRKEQVALPEDSRSSTQEVLLLLVAVRTHSSVDEGEQRLHQIQHQRTAGLSGHEHLNQVQHLQHDEQPNTRGTQV